MKQLSYILLGTSLLFTACGENNDSEEKVEETVIAPAPLKLTEASSSPDFNDAKLSLGEVTTTPNGDKSKVTFNFKVENYELMNQTSDANTKMCANSDKGQHIHFILDNEPYAALYEPKHEISLEKGSEHYLLAFLSRSYHESVKSEGASFVYHFKVDENGNIKKLDAPKEPLLFYSRPKGKYVGIKETDKLLLDFFVWNTEIGEDGNHVLAHIKGNGVDTTMNINKWQAYFLHNMPMGTPSITLTLVDKDGNEVEGPMSKVTREFTLAAEEPITTE